MTTNHLERLDPALIRPGRVDVQLEIGHATPPQIRGMFLRFFPAADAQAEEFVRAVGAAQRRREAHGQKGALSMAELQGYFLVHKHSMHTALEHADQIHDAQKQLAVAASFVHSISAVTAAQSATASPAATAATAASPTAERVVAVPDTPVHPDVIAQIQKRIAAEEAAAQKEASGSGAQAGR